MNNYIRKMLIGIFTMLFLLTGCSSESKNDPEEQDSENSGQSQIRVEESQEPVSENDNTEGDVITDITTWEHPTKKVFEKYNIVVDKIELLNDKTYPVFYCSFPQKIDFNDQSSKQFYLPILNKLAKENGYWDFKLQDSNGVISISATCEKKWKRLEELKYFDDQGITVISDWVVHISVASEDSYEDAIYYDVDEKNIIEIRDHDLLRVRFYYDYNEMDLEEANKYLIVSPEDLRKYMEIQRCYMYLTKENNTVFGGFQLAFSQDMPKCEFEIETPEGFASGEVIGGKYTIT